MISCTSALLVLAAGSAAGEGWQQPPEPIRTILDRPATPTVDVSPDGRWVVELASPAMEPLAVLAAPMVRVAGLRIDPATNATALRRTWSGLAFRELRADRARRVEVHLPTGARVDHLAWSPDATRLAFTLTVPDGLELWLVEAGSAEPRRLTGPVLNAAYGAPCDWLPGERGLICKRVPAGRGRAPEEPLVPDGPRIEENAGRSAPARTYQDLLEDAHDEALFEHYLTSELVRVSLERDITGVVPPALIDEAEVSPDGRFLLVRTVHRPFSTSVPVGRFPQVIEVWDLEAGTAVTVEDLPLADDVPIKFGSVRNGMREVSWREDAPATLYTVEALDGGDAGREAEWRDAVSLLEAPFDGEPRPLVRTALRFSGITWGDEDTALLTESWWADRRTRTWVIDPGRPGASPRLFDERSMQDYYADPGDPLTGPGPFGRQVLRFAPGGEVYLAGEGHGPTGPHPFLDRRDLATGKTERLWQSEDPWLERVVDVLDATRFVTLRESSEQPPNLVLRSVGRKRPTAELTAFADPVPELARVEPKVVRYARADGLELSAKVYLPPGYDPRRDGPLPTVFWAYPSEFKRRSDAAQVLDSPHAFRRPAWTSHLWFLLHGYAVVDDPVIPIVGEGDAQPNDTYVEQLVAGAEAAVRFAVSEGFADPRRLVIGGHSYGAFTVANLLAHTDLFAAGIARSGAYNRTLTPFGFQGEERSFWEAPATYVAMSPFAVADAIDEPLLLVHGGRDANPGTFPVQSERLYEAIKGLGGTVRWVELPFEDHGYRGRESVGHVVWEMFRWADTWAVAEVGAASGGGP